MFKLRQKAVRLFLLVLLQGTGFLGFSLRAQSMDSLVFHNALEFKLLGRSWLQTEREDAGAEISAGGTSAGSAILPEGYAFGRLPFTMKDSFRPALWDLGLCAAGLAIRFCSDSPVIGVRWEPLRNFAMNHMAATGVRGLDLYVLTPQGWHFAGTAVPSGKKPCSARLLRNMDATMKEYMLYLPLYDGLKSLQIGVAEGSLIERPRVDLPQAGHPIVFYGTSITQGGCVSRPGMCYTSVFERFVQRETVNLGFSGNARMDAAMAEVLVRTPASAYFIDCLPNCTVDLLKTRGYAFMHALVSAKPDTPCYMVENQIEPKSLFDSVSARAIEQKNREWARIYKRLRLAGFTRLHYVRAQSYGDADGESTVDGVHLTDLGALRMAEALFEAYRAEGTGSGIYSQRQTR